MRQLTTLLGVAIFVVIIGFATLRAGEPARAAFGPCDPLSPGVSSLEAELLSQVNGWRADAFGAPAMTAAGPANAAAQWFAEAMVADETQGHTDVFGRDWVDRLLDCGWTGRFASGEALAGFGSATRGSVPLRLRRSRS